jgi:hypothetical protein
MMAQCCGAVVVVVVVLGMVYFWTGLCSFLCFIRSVKKNIRSFFFEIFAILFGDKKGLTTSNCC